MRRLARLRSCRAIAATGERVACYDNKVGALLGAGDSGDVRLIDREQMRKTKRHLFDTTIASGG